MTDHEQDYQELVQLLGPDNAEALKAVAGGITKEVDILVFASPTCRACPHQINSVAALTLAAPTVAAEVVDTSQEQELAMQYEVRAVPTTVIDDEMILVGVTPPLKLAETLLLREGPEGERAVFNSWMATARFGEAADHLVFGPDPEASTRVFMELWAAADEEQRRALTGIVDAALNRAPDGLPGLGELVAVAVDGGAPESVDEFWLEDTQALLNRIRA